MTRPPLLVVLDAVWARPVPAAIVTSIGGLILYFLHQVNIHYSAAAAKRQRLQERYDQEEKRRRQKQSQKQRQKQRKKNQKAKELALWNAASDEIDLYIRSLRKFNTATPREYRCKIRQIAVDCEYDFDDGLDVKSVCEWDHDRFNVRKNSVSVKYLTPYQGRSRMYGHFECSKCHGRRWKSGSSWANTWQQCKGCQTRVYPHDQETLVRRSDEARRRKPLQHDTRRCQKCIKLGHDCHYD